MVLGYGNKTVKNGVAIAWGLPRFFI